MSKDIRIKKGFDIQLIGQAEMKLKKAPRSAYYSVRPTDFHGLTPKLHLKVGAKLDVGTPIFYDKNQPQINVVSPVSGELVEIKRGAKRKILDLIIKADATDARVEHEALNLDSASREDLLAYMLKAGVWPFIKQLPYAVIADPSIQPKFINISSFNSEPLAADDSFMIEGKAEAFQKGIDALAKLTSGAVQLNLKGKGNNSTVFSQAKNCRINTVSGPHPAGNNGVQIHHLNPVNKNESVWYLRPQGVVAIGELLMTKSYNPTRLVAVCGEKASETSYVEAIQGAKAADLLAGASMDNTRLISGTVLTGQQIESEDSINFYANELTLIEEGNEAEFLGWVLPGLGKLSLSRTFFSWLNTKKKYSVNTNLHGEERAYVVTGQYERYLPMDIHPVHLVKAAMANDIELMEHLGIYEVSPEDFALCEFACTSKIEVQQVIREALDLVKKELS